RDADVPSGVVDEDVDPAELAHHCVDAGIDRFRIALVQLHGEALPTELLHRVDRRIGTTRLADIGNGDIRPRRGKSLHDRSTDVARAPGYEGDFFSEVHSAPRSPATSIASANISLRVILDSGSRRTFQGCRFGFLRAPSAQLSHSSRERFAAVAT